MVSSVDGEALADAARAARSEPGGVLAAAGAFGVAFVLRALAWRRVLPRTGVRPLPGGNPSGLGRQPCSASAPRRTASRRQCRTPSRDEPGSRRGLHRDPARRGHAGGGRGRGGGGAVGARGARRLDGLGRLGRSVWGRLGGLGLAAAAGTRRDRRPPPGLRGTRPVRRGVAVRVGAGVAGGPLGGTGDKRGRGRRGDGGVGCRPGGGRGSRGLRNLRGCRRGRLCRSRPRRRRRAGGRADGPRAQDRLLAGRRSRRRVHAEPRSGRTVEAGTLPRASHDRVAARRRPGAGRAIHAGPQRAGIGRRLCSAGSRLGSGTARTGTGDRRRLH